MVGETGLCTFQAQAPEAVDFPTPSSESGLYKLIMRSIIYRTAVNGSPLFAGTRAVRIAPVNESGRFSRPQEGSRRERRNHAQPAVRGWVEVVTSD